MQQFNDSDAEMRHWSFAWRCNTDEDTRDVGYSVDVLTLRLITSLYSPTAADVREKMTKPRGVAPSGVQLQQHSTMAVHTVHTVHTCTLMSSFNWITCTLDTASPLPCRWQSLKSYTQPTSLLVVFTSALDQRDIGLHVYLQAKCRSPGGGALAHQSLLYRPV